MRVLVPAVLLCLVVLGQTHSAQAPGVVAGMVVDRAGAVLPGATVELLAGDRVVKSTTTDERGAFRFAGVAPGTYRLRAVLAGFVTVDRPLVVAELPVSSIRLVLEPLPRQETVTVTADAAARQVVRAPGMADSAASPVRGESEPDAALFAGFRYRREPFNTESYAHLAENRFHRVADDPLSTFSIDVDTASYANVRRFLNDGVLPPPAAVRIEELVNYFRFSYDDPPADQPFSIRTEVSVCPWNPRHRLALIGLQARRLEEDRTPPRNLVFLLDVSGSMDTPDKLPLVKAAMRMLVDTLKASDRVAIVVYAGASGVALPTTPGDQKARIHRAVAELYPGGSTNGAAGIRLAYDLAERSFIRGGINRVILATDGDFNVGVTSEGELVRLIEKQRERGVFLSVLGVGTGNLKDSTMEALANKGNGNYAYLDSLHEARRVLVAEAGSTLVTVAKDVKIQVEFNPETVAAYRLIGYENRVLANRDFNDDRKDAGEIGAGHTVTALYEIVPPGETVEGGTIDPLKYQRRLEPTPAARSGELMTVKLRYKAPASDSSQLISVVARDASGEPGPNIGFAAAVAEFGLLLRRSQFTGQATWASVRELAERHRGPDPGGYRAEFLKLVDLAAALDAHSETSAKR